MASLFDVFERGHEDGMLPDDQGPDAVPLFGLDGTIDALSMQALLPAFASSPYELSAFPLSYCQPLDLATPPSLDEQMMVQGVGMIGDIAFGTSLQAVRNLDGTIQADTVAGPSWGNNRMLSTSMGSNALVLVPASIDVSLFSSNNKVTDIVHDIGALQRLEESNNNPGLHLLRHDIGVGHQVEAPILLSSGSGEPKLVAANSGKVESTGSSDNLDAAEKQAVTKKIISKKRGTDMMTFEEQNMPKNKNAEPMKKAHVVIDASILSSILQRMDMWHADYTNIRADIEALLNTASNTEPANNFTCIQKTIAHLSQSNHVLAESNAELANPVLSLAHHSGLKRLNSGKSVVGSGSSAFNAIGRPTASDDEFPFFAKRIIYQAEVDLTLKTLNTERRRGTKQSGCILVDCKAHTRHPTDKARAMGLSKWIFSRKGSELNTVIVHFDGLPAVHLQVSDFLDYDMKRNQNEDMLCKAMIILLRDLENNRIQDSTELLPRHYATHEWAEAAFSGVVDDKLLALFESPSAPLSITNCMMVVCPFKRLNTWCCIAINLLLRTITIMEPNTADEKDEELFRRYDGPCKYMVKACLACILKAKSPDKSLMEGWTIRLMFEKPYSCASSRSLLFTMSCARWFNGEATCRHILQEESLKQTMDIMWAELVYSRMNKASLPKSLVELGLGDLCSDNYYGGTNLVL